MSGGARAYAVVYDGGCGMCARLVARLARWDRHGELEMLPSQQPGVRERFPWIRARAFADSIQVVRVSDGTTWQGAAAVEQLLRVLPRGRWISWIFAIPFARSFAETVYRWVARNRYQMGCGEHCGPHAARPSE
jgi:predicted DCC family thiol-disulfide oxidoreductase YuxK